ncbi:MAG TPA: hypothetical protein VHV08_11660 [Pirellulales bacterium]|nr:hypothetical protein [Pirellulales bacterium]
MLHYSYQLQLAWFTSEIKIGNGSMECGRSGRAALVALGFSAERATTARTTRDARMTGGVNPPMGLVLGRAASVGFLRWPHRERHAGAQGRRAIVGWFERVGTKAVRESAATDFRMAMIRARAFSQAVVARVRIEAEAPTGDAAARGEQLNARSPSAPKVQLSMKHS